jgi:hypothetical protein
VGLSACQEGVARQFVNLAGRGQDGLAYCAALAGAEAKRACYASVGREIGYLEPAAERRAALCAGAEPGYVEVCLAGALGRPRGAGGTDGPSPPVVP